MKTFPIDPSSRPASRSQTMPLEEEVEDDMAKNICDLSYPVRQSLWFKFEENQNWKKVLSCRTLSKDVRYNCQKATTRKMDRGRALYISLGNQGMTVGGLIALFDELEMDDAKAVLVEYESPIIKQNPKESITAVVGQCVQIYCKASGVPPPTYQWFKNDQELLNQTKPQLALFQVTTNDTGDYWCRVSNTNPNTRDTICTYTSRCRLIVEQGKPPEIIEHPFNPSSGKVKQGASIILRCVASSTSGAVVYQWFKNGVLISGQNSEELRLEHLQADKGGHVVKFQCAVSNAFDTVLSELVTIELDYEDNTTQHFVKDKVALIVGNEVYENFDRLMLPKTDAKTLADCLSLHGFRVFAMIDLNLVEMRNAIRLFCHQIEEETYAVAYFAGHGFEAYGKKYLLPTDATDLTPDESICVEDHLIRMMQIKHPKLCAIILDICRKMPDNAEDNFAKFRKPEGKPVMGANTLLAYATTSLRSAHEVEGRDNGVYMGHLKKHIMDKRPLTEVLRAVNEEFMRDDTIADKQIPWSENGLYQELSLADGPLPVPETSIIARHSNEWLEYMSAIDVDVDLQSEGLILRIMPRMYEEVFCNAMNVEFECVEQYEGSRCWYGENGHQLVINEQPIDLHALGEKSLFFPDLQKFREDFILEVCLVHTDGSVCFKEEVNFRLPFIARAKLWMNRLEVKEG